MVVIEDLRPPISVENVVGSCASLASSSLQLAAKWWK